MNKYIQSLLIGSYLWYFGFGLLGPLYAVFAERIGGDILSLTGAYSLYLFSTGSLSVFVGRLSDECSKEKLMLIGYYINAIATASYLLVNAPIQLYIVQLFLGIATAFATPTWDALFSQHLDSRKEGKEWGFSDGAPQVISAFSLLCGGIIVKYFGFVALFSTMGAIQLLAAILQTTLLRRIS